MFAVAILVLGGCASGHDASGPASSTSATTAKPPLLVNLGDSYAAAAGVPPLEAGSSFLCYRSAHNAAHLLAAAHGYRLVDVSCSGAKTTDFFDAQYAGVPPQLDAITADAAVVTMMIGGNDGDVYGRAISTCSNAAQSDPSGSPCRNRYGTQYTDTVTHDTFAALMRAFTAVRAKAPHARTLVIGYPWLVPADGGCRPAVRIADGDIPYVRDLEATLDGAIRRAAARTGVTYVDMAAVSTGHDACAPAATRWIEPQVGARGALALHPNLRGQQAIADAVAKILE